MTAVDIPTNMDVVNLIASSYEPSMNSQWTVLYKENKTAGIHAGLKQVGNVSVVIFRGSVTPEDWMRDLVSELFGFIDNFGSLGPLPLGFLQGMSTAWHKIVPYLQSSVIVGGHSLGAAHAAIFSGMLMASRRKILQTVLCGCPRPGMRTLKELLAKTDILNIRNLEDFVTDAPSSPPYEQVRFFTEVDGGQGSDPLDPFRMHHIQFYVNGFQKLIESQPKLNLISMD